MTPPINSVSDEVLAELLAYEGDLYMSRAAQPHLRSLLTELAARRAANTPVGDGVDWGHVINEWADTVTNCIQWFRNIRDDYSSPQDALDNVEPIYNRILALSRNALSASPALPSQVVDDKTIERAAKAIAESAGDVAWEKIEPLYQEGYRDEARAALTAAAKVRANSEGDGEWQPIETAPKDGSWFLGYRPDLEAQEAVDIWHWDAEAETDGAPGFWINAADSNLDETPTHWRPMPTPPVASASKEVTDILRQLTRYSVKPGSDVSARVIPDANGRWVSYDELAALTLPERGM